MRPAATKPQGADSTMQAGAGALKLVLAYALVASLWILLSDEAVGWLFSDPVNIVRASTLKGWLFVAVTSLLLYGTVRRMLVQARTSSLHQRAAQMENRRTQRLLAAIVDGSTDAIYAKDLEGRYLVFNREIARATGKTAELALGCDDTALFAPQQAAAIRANDRRVIDGNLVDTYEENLSTVDGERTYLATKGPLRDGDGRVVGVFGISRDITERKRADIEVRTLSRAVEQSPASIVITDRAANIAYVNPRFEQVSGYARTEVVGRNPRILKSGVVSSETYAQLWATLSAGGEWRGELCNRRKNGELFWEYAAISGLRGESGGIEHYIAVKEDITERKAAEAKIQRLSNLYAALSQCNRAVVHCATEQELFQEICNAIVNFGGMKMAWIGMVDPASSLVRPVASYGDVTRYLEGLEVSVDPGITAGRGPGGTSIRENRPIWCQDFLHDPSTKPWHERARRTGWQAVAAVPLCRNGAAIGALSIYSPEINAFDESARNLLIEMAANVSFALDNFAREAERRRVEDSLRDSESRLSAIFHASPTSIVVSTVAQGRICEINDAALRLYGRTREEVIGREVDALGIYADPAQREALLGQLRERGGIDRFPIEVRMSGGKSGVVEVTGRVIEFQGEPCLIATMLDATERKRLEEVHLRAQKLESLGTLAGGIAHDFNNILAAIRGNADVAARDVGADHAAAESLEEIRKAGVRASELVRRIMAFGRPTETRHELVDLGAVVDEVLKLLRATLPVGISLKKEFVRDAPQVLADAGQIHEVIVNLTTNAAYAIGAHAGAIIYRLEPVQVGAALARTVPGVQEGSYARLTVSDDGCGMDAAVLERIFDAFYTTKPSGEGTGLGLSMVHGVMRSHRGAVTVESAAGKGSSFALYFPAAEADAARPDVRIPVANAPRAAQRVLFVDDEEALVFLARRVLTRLGHSVAGFTDPEQALEAFRAHPQDFDVVVTDLSMPHMSGFALAREVLAERPGMPVLMTTGYLRAEDEERARAAGIREVVLKPVTMDELGQVIDRWIRDS